MRSIFRISFLFAIWTTLLSSNGISAIINGKNITSDQKLHQFPYLVSFVNSSIDHWCGGSIISDEFVLTSAHCVMRTNNTFYSFPRLIVGGVNNLNIDEDTKVIVEVDKVFVDKRYDHFIWSYNVIPEYDWALLKLKTKLDIKNNPNLSIIDLPKKIPGTEHYPSYTNVIGKFAGFGNDYVRLIIRNQTGFIISEYEADYDILTEKKHNFTVTDTGNSTGLLHWVDVKILDSKECDYKYRNNFSNSKFCAVIIPNTKAPHGPCSGDSGSPLVFENTVIGLLSSSAPGCNENRTPSAYTKVSPYVESIKNVMKGITDGMRIGSAAVDYY